MTTLRQPLTNKNLNNSSGKCGEITYCIQVGKRVYALNCLYCPQICLQWDIFINHMEQEHDENLNSMNNDLPLENVETESQTDQVQDDISVKLHRNITTPTVFNNKLDERDRFPFNDPLGDNSTNAMTLEGSIKVEKIDCTPIQSMVDDDVDDFQYDKIEDDKNDDEMEFNKQFTYNVANQPIEPALKKDIQHIKEQLDTNNRLMRELFEEIKLIQHNNVPHFPNTPRILPKKPFGSKEAFLKFETKIQESEEHFANLVKDLKEQSSGNSSQFIKNCWRLLIKDEVAKEFCWQGSKEKIGIKNFSTLLAIRLSYAKKFTDHNETEFERVVIMFFQQAKNRFEKKMKQ